MNTLQKNLHSTIATTALTPDRDVINCWLLTKRSERTREEYARDIKRFCLSLPVGVTLKNVTLAHVLDYQQSLIHLKPSTQKRMVSAVKSLLSFAHTTGYTQFNVGAVVKPVSVPNERAQRILTELEVFQLLAGVKSQRDRLMLRLLYTTGVRVSELTALCWKDLQPRNTGGQVTVFGKGGKSRAVTIPQQLWDELMHFKPANHSSTEPVFKSRQCSKDGSHFLTKQQVLRILKAAARIAGVTEQVSPHWMRHAHASHSLDRGAPISLVSQTLGHANIATTNAYLHARPEHSSSEYLPAV